MDCAFADLIPFLWTHHHLTCRATLAFHMRYGYLFCSGNTVIFCEQRIFQLASSFIPLLGKFCDTGLVAISSKLGSGLFVRQSQFLIRNRFMQCPLLSFKLFGLDQTGNLDLFEAVNFLLAESDLMFQGFCLTVALHTV